jgi:hypothetical protein
MRTPPDFANVCKKGKPMEVNREFPPDLKGKVELTGQSLIDKMREAVAPPGKKGTWLRKLNNHQLAEVYHRLKLGQPAYKIAQIAQVEWGYHKKSAIKSLARAVRKFKEDMLGDLTLEKTSPFPSRAEEGKKLSKRAQNIVKMLDSMGRYRWAIECQTERVAILREREKNAIPFKATEDAIRTLSDMLDRYTHLEIKLGTLDSKPSEINLNIKGRFDGLLQHTVQPGTAVVEATDKWLSLCEKNALTLKLGEDGAYRLEAPEEEFDACSPKSPPD